MKTKTTIIPFFAALSCSLTACTNEKEELEEDNIDAEDSDTEDSDTEDTDTDDTDDTGNDIGDLSDVLGLWGVDSQGFYGYNITFPQENSYTLEAYDVEWIQGYTRSIFHEVFDDGTMEELNFVIETETLIINGVEVSYSSIGMTQVNEGSGYDGYGYDDYSYGMTIRETGGTYVISTFGIELNCSLTGDALSCADNDGLLELDLSKATEGIPDDFTDIRENFPETPEYTKTDCVDATITTTGNSIEMGGFEDIDGDVAFECDLLDNYGYSSSSAPNHEDLVFAFTAPNDGCFAFDTTGTNFEHGIQLMEACGEEVLDCSMDGNLLQDMTAGEEILLVIDGRERNDQVFNLHINEQIFDLSSYEEIPADTSSMDNSSWTEMIDAGACGMIENGKTFLWTAPATGTASFDLAGTDFLVIMDVREASCSGGDEYCNGDAGFGGNSVLEVPVEEGMSYLVSVGGLWGFTGNISLNVSLD